MFFLVEMKALYWAQSTVTGLGGWLGGGYSLLLLMFAGNLKVLMRKE